MTISSAGGGCEHVKPGNSGLINFIAKADRMKGDFSHGFQVFSHQRLFAIFRPEKDIPGLNPQFLAGILPGNGSFLPAGDAPATKSVLASEAGDNPTSLLPIGPIVLRDRLALERQLRGNSSPATDAFWLPLHTSHRLRCDKRSVRRGRCAIRLCTTLRQSPF
jgi:hypothetical protein